MNLNIDEQAGMNSLLKRIKNEELMIVPTDKSGRFSVLSLDQYLKSGQKHTAKDELISWDKLKYLRNQVNGHMLWLTKIVSYSVKNDQQRMLKNNFVSDLDVPEMSILIKDHKKWSVDSGEPVPSRPVLSGNNTINTHLSELISELLEPIASEFTGAEIQSTEEALSILDEINWSIEKNGQVPRTNVLEKFINNQGYDAQQSTDCANQFIATGFGANMAELVSHENNHTTQTFPNFSDPGTGGLARNKDNVEQGPNTMSGQDLMNSSKLSDPDTSNSSILSTDTQTIKILESLEREGCMSGLGGSQFKNKSDAGTENEVKPVKSIITDYFTDANKMDTKCQTSDWLEIVSNTARKKYKGGMATLNMTVLEGVKAGNYWLDGMNIKENADNMSLNTHCNCLESEYNVDSDLSKQHMAETQPLQDSDAKPVLFGSDVVALYPNLDDISVAAISGEAILKTNVQFKNINYPLLMVYLLLVLGITQLRKLGLDHCAPRRKNMKYNSNSLISKANRDLETWEFNNTIFSESEKRKMISTMVQVMILLMTRTTCYRFNGQIYRQSDGLGIGLRASAALARLTMCVWDSLWGGLQYSRGLIILAFFRYVDDLRFYLRPISKGWWWSNGKWLYCPHKIDERTPDERTIQEIGKSLGDVLPFIKFTTESEGEFANLHLPTLDFETHVCENGYIDYRFFSKPMSNNVVLQRGTALSKDCVFNSLRQDLVRRLLNTDLKQDISIKVGVVENFIQLLVNSGHQFTYIKSIILQALTKYKHMVERSMLDKKNKRYMPLHRPRQFNMEGRLLEKYISQSTWYTDTRIGDAYRNTWKKWVKRKKKCIHIGRGKGCNKPPITTTLFVPSSPSSKLVDMVRHSLDMSEQHDQWRTKVLEKPGTPLFRKFMKTFCMKEGCARGAFCTMCSNKGIGCTVRNAVYSAKCMLCDSMQESVYIGESSRQVGTRAGEHINNVSGFKKDSFILQHWMLAHGTSPVPPQFKFKVLSCHRDALGRQIREAIQIKQVGTLNRKDEFAVNELIRLEPSKCTRDKDIDHREELREKSDLEELLTNFVTVMLDVKEKCRAQSNLLNSRYKRPSRVMEGMQAEPEKKRGRMITSTPVQYRTTELIASPDSLEGSNLSNRESSGMESPTAKGGSKTGVSYEMDKFRLSPLKLEKLEMLLAKNKVAVQEYAEADSFYRKRSRSLPRNLKSSQRCLVQKSKFTKCASLSDLIDGLELMDWSSTKFKKCDSDINSFEEADLINESGQATPKPHEEGLNAGDSDNENPPVGDTDSVNDLDEQIVDSELVENIVQHLKKNKLYNIYKEDEVGGDNLSKRKLSPTAETPRSKAGRLGQLRTRTIEYYFGGDSSPKLRGNDEETIRPRCGSMVLTPTRKNNIKKTARRRCLSLASDDPKQQLIKNVWKNIAKKCMDQEDDSIEQPGGSVTDQVVERQSTIQLEK